MKYLSHIAVSLEMLQGVKKNDNNIIVFYDGIFKNNIIITFCSDLKKLPSGEAVIHSIIVSSDKENSLLVKLRLWQKYLEDNKLTQDNNSELLLEIEDPKEEFRKCLEILQVMFKNNIGYFIDANKANKETSNVENLNLN